MSLLDDFELLKEEKKISVSVTKDGITFSIDTAKVLGNPSNVNVYFTDKQMAIKPASSGGLAFVRNKKNCARWTKAELKNKLVEVSGLTEITDKRFEGKYYANENVVIFDFSKGSAVKKKERHAT